MSFLDKKTKKQMFFKDILWLSRYLGKEACFFRQKDRKTDVFLRRIVVEVFSQKIGCGAAVLCLTEVWSDHREV